MAEQSTGKEFLELAIEIERNGYNFYTSAAQEKSKEIKDILMQLAGREKEHEHTFRDMLTRVGGYVAEHPCENYEYIKTLAETSIFIGKQAQELLTRKKMTDVEAFEVGIGFEKDSILLYSEVRGMVPRPDQDIIDMITNEEKKHLSELMYMANKMRSG
ncbi:MAG: ferritin family protein [Dehalococcoidales bacterium]|nr:ferritin family protein [Dehalococcoidales bacterium]